MLKNFRTWIATKLNPAQPSISAEYGESAPSNILDFKTAYNQIEVIHRAVEIIINACAEIPFQVTGGAEKKIDKLLNKYPNPFEDRTRLFRRAFLDFIIDGNAFFYYDAKNTALYVLPANNVTVVPDKKKFVKEFTYSPGTIINQADSIFFNPNQSTNSQEEISFSPDEIIHIKSDNIDNIYRGVSRLQSIQRIIELYYSMISFQRNFFNNNAIPGLVLTTDNVLGKKIKDRLLAEWREAYTTIFKGARSPAILDGGLKIDKFSNINFSELDFENSVDRLQQDMSNVLGVPYILIKSGNNANIVNNQVILYLHTVLPILLLFSSAFNAFFGIESTIRPDKTSVAALRPDTRSEALFYSTLVNTGIITPAEARQGLRFSKLVDKDGNGVPDMDNIRIPQNITGSATNPALGGRPVTGTPSSPNAESL